MTGRIPITDVTPTVDAGAFPAKSSVGETFTIAATVFREGHDAVNANVVLTSPTGQTRRMLMTPVGLGTDRLGVAGPDAGLSLADACVGEGGFRGQPTLGHWGSVGRSLAGEALEPQLVSQRVGDRPPMACEAHDIRLQSGEQVGSSDR